MIISGENIYILDLEVMFYDIIKPAHIIFSAVVEILCHLGKNSYLSATISSVTND